MHTVWLASWYPSDADPFNGDFIQRHALSLATRGPVTVIHVTKATHRTQFQNGILSRFRKGPLTEIIGYTRPASTPLRWWNAAISGWRSFGLYRKALLSHMEAHGKPELLHVHVCMNAGIFALWASLRWKIPYVVTEHYTAYIPGAPDYFGNRSFLYRQVNRLILKRACGVHSVSAFLLGCLEHVSPIRNAVVIPNSVDTDLFCQDGSWVGTGEPGVKGAPFRFIHASTYLAHKNVQGMLDAFAILLSRRQDWELVLVGPAGPEIRSYGHALGLSGHIQWTGELPYAGVAAQMKRAQVLVHFSNVENQPCVISEALCCGLPVLAPAIGGIPEVIGDGKGKLVAPGDTHALADALETMMAEFGTYDRERIAREACARHSYTGVGQQLDQYYESLKVNLR